MGTRLGITCTDGSLWNEHRSFVVRQLKNVGYGKTKMDSQIQDELKELTSVIESSKEPIWPADILPASVINVLWTFVTGSRIKRNDSRLARFLDLLHKRSKAFDMAGGTLSQMPWIRFIAPEKSGYNLITSLNKEFSKFFMEIINEHHENYSELKAEEDLIYAFIKEMKNQENNPKSTFSNIQLAMIILDIFIAGSQTTSITLDLALMMMLVRPDIQEKCHKEIDESEFGTKEITYHDRYKFPFIEAFLLEVQRFFHIVPIAGPRRTMKDTTLAKYDIPYNTTILFGLRSVHMDKDYWKNPEDFVPERFLDENMNIINTERLIPFGLGRRRCLGDALARACIFTFFVGVLRKFNLKECPYEKPSLNLLPGITLSPKKYKIIFEKR
jgi:cytochrome P450